MTSPSPRGKISRLPRDIRQELNIRLDDGLDAGQILSWLNNLPEVREVLDAKFNGVPVSPQNLSAWRQGGFQEWLFHQRYLETAILLREHTLEIDKTLNTAMYGSERGAADFMLTHFSIQMAAGLARWDGPNLSSELANLLKIGQFLVKLQAATARSERQAIELAQLQSAARFSSVAHDKVRSESYWAEHDKQIAVERAKSSAPQPLPQSEKEHPQREQEKSENTPNPPPPPRAPRQKTESNSIKVNKGSRIQSVPPEDPASQSDASQRDGVSAEKLPASFR